MEKTLALLHVMRLSATEGLQIDRETKAYIHEHTAAFAKLSPEQVKAELFPLLCGENVLEILLEYPDVFSALLPELAPCVGFEQNNLYHQYSVYDHIAHAVASAPENDLTVRLALLFHDIGKPLCYTEDDRGGHFYGHAKISAELAQQRSEHWKIEDRLQNEVQELVLRHDAVIEATPKAVGRWLTRLGQNGFFRLLDVKRADTLAQVKQIHAERLAQLKELDAIAGDVLAEQKRFSTHDLAVNGRDLLALGIPEGVQIGSILQILFEEVSAGLLDNGNAQLLSRANDLR
jgi:tRNA nucleotidyltransferase (CCA-adding enzyme)